MYLDLFRNNNTGDNNVSVFLALVKAGLWGNRDEFHVPDFKFLESVDLDEIYQLAEEQSVIGIVLAGMEQSNIKPPRELLLQWIGEAQMLERQNKAMNLFIAELIEKMRKADIYTLLVKGQGIAQCYEKPLWRACGDVDLFLNEENYEKAKALLLPLSSSSELEYKNQLHLGMTIEQWVVELHGTMRTCSFQKIDKVVDNVQNDIFSEGHVRVWNNQGTEIPLPSIDNDVILVFTHILKHFFHGGIGLRQICDWCRLLWTYKGEFDLGLLEARIREAGIMTEWKAFASLAGNYLGMPTGAIPLYEDSKHWKHKADRIIGFVLKTGNFGCNRHNNVNYPKIIRKAIALWQYTSDYINHSFIFPMDSLRAWSWELKTGIFSFFDRNHTNDAK